MTSAMRDGVRVAGQPVAALGAPLAGHHAGPAQVGQDGPEEPGRQALLPRQVLGRLRRPGGRQGEQGPDAVVDLGRDVHGESLPAPGARGHFPTWPGGRAKISGMARIALHITGDDEADAVLSRDPLALLIGMVLDQQIPIEKAFSSPADLLQRLGTSGPLDAAAIAAMDPEELAAVFRERPALHRYPGSMAGRVQAVCRVVADEYGNKADDIWKGVQSGDELHRPPARPAGLRRAEGQDLRRAAGQAAGRLPGGLARGHHPLRQGGQLPLGGRHHRPREPGQGQGHQEGA